MLPIQILRLRNAATANPALGYISPFYPTTLYSMRLRNALYAGPCCRVKNLTTTTETDIGFGPDGWIDEAALAATWTSGDVIRMTKWYDQAGGVDLAQATDGNMPLMLGVGGTGSLINGHVAPRWDDSSRIMAVATADAAFGFGSGAHGVECVVNSTGLDAGHLNSLVDFRSGSGAGTALFFVGSATGYGSGFYNGTFFGGVAAQGAGGPLANNGVTYSLAWTGDAANEYSFIDGSLVDTNAVALAFGSTRPLWLGNSREFNNSEWPGMIGELIITNGSAPFTSGYTPRAY